MSVKPLERKQVAAPAGHLAKVADSSVVADSCAVVSDTNQPRYPGIDDSLEILKASLSADTLAAIHVAVMRRRIGPSSPIEQSVEDLWKQCEQLSTSFANGGTGADIDPRSALMQTVFAPTKNYIDAIHTLAIIIEELIERKIDDEVIRSFVVDWYVPSPSAARALMTSVISVNGCCVASCSLGFTTAYWINPWCMKPLCTITTCSKTTPK